MPEQTTPEVGNASVGYEKSDTQIGAIVAFGIALAVIIVVVHVASALLFAEFKASAHKEDPGLPPVAAKERLQLPRDLEKIPQPRLQEAPTLDLDRMRQAEEVQLTSYGWVDPKTNSVRIPVAEAMRILADPELAKARGIRVEVAKKIGGPR